MKILLCPDKFKGSLSSEEVCESLRNGILTTQPTAQVAVIPMADGGDGSVEIIKERLGLNRVSVQTLDPLGRDISSSYYISDDAAFIELANASGLVLLQENERNPFNTSTLGTGLMIKDALLKGFKKIYIFIGGSATNDAGIGIAQALGFDFLSEKGELLNPIGSSLAKIKFIENHKRFDFEALELIVLCDVSNPMYGANGAAYTYAKQKGASDDEIVKLDQGLKNYALVLKEQLNKELKDKPGMGAAGAIGASLVGLMDANLQNGFQMLSELMQLESHIKNSDLVITGEGKIDSTSLEGKVVGNVVTLCKEHDKKCGLVAGIIDIPMDGAQITFEHSIISRAENMKDAMTDSKKYLLQIGEEIGASLP